MNGEDYEARKDEHRRDWPGYHDPLCLCEQCIAHDPLCACAESNCLATDCDACDCALIARVREDERGKDELIVANAWNAGWQQGLSAAREAVEDRRVPWPTATGDLVNEGIDDALAAIDALKEES